MKLYNQLLGFGAVGIAGIALVGCVAYWSSTGQDQSLGEVLTSSTAVRASMDGDMMHDAIRGDALASLVAAAAHDAAGIENAGKELAAHRQRYDEALTTLAAQPLNDDVRARLADVRQLVAAYGEASAEVQRASRVDLATAQAALPAFQDKFSALETKMEELGDAILAQAQASADEGREVGVRAHAMIIGMVMAAGLVLGGISLLLARRLVQPLRRAVEVADRIAQGDLGIRVPAGTYDESVALMTSLERMRAELASLSGTVLEQAQQVAASAQQVAAGSEAIENDTRRSHADIEASREALQSVGGDVQGNLAQTREADDLARSAAQVARDGGAAVARVVQTMGGITESSRRIGDIIAVIDGIAFQTNILALNAAVEAARAGEQGRGFAVVASEVRSLAPRSAGAAREIKTLISESIERVDAGRAQVDEAGATMQHIVGSIGRVSELIGRISEATTRQSERIGEVQDTFLRVDATMDKGATLTRESSAAAGSMMEQAQRLLTAASGFRVAPRD